MKRNWLGYSLVAVMALIPFNIERSICGIWVTSSDIMVALLTAVWVKEVIVKRISNLFMPLLPLIGGLLALFMVSAYGALDQSRVMIEFFKFVMVFALFFCLVNNISDDKLLKMIPAVVTATVSALGICFISDFGLGNVSPWDRLWHRHVLNDVHLNALGMFVAAALPFALFELIKEDKIVPKAAAGLGLVIQLIALFLTYSRGSWVAIALIAALFLSIKYKLKGLVYFTVFIILPFTLLTVAFPQLQLKLRLFSIVDKKEASIIVRKEHIRSAYELIKLKPFTGVGLDNFQVASKKYLNRDVTEIVHNIFLQFGAEAGIAAMVLFLIIVLKYLIDVHSIYTATIDPFLKHLVIFSALSFIALMVSAQFGDPFVRSIKEYFALALALPYAIKKLSLNEQRTADNWELHSNIVIENQK